MAPILLSRVVLRTLALALPLAVSAPLAAQIGPVLGTGQGSGDEILVPGLPLGFNFTFPDGTVVSQVSVTSNGRCFPDGGAMPDFTADPLTLVTGTTSICTFWEDLDTTTGDIFFGTTPGSAVITWVDHTVFGTVDPFSFQLELRSDNSFQFFYDSRLDIVNQAFPLSVVGCSSGNGAIDPGPTDLSAAMALDTGVDPTIYEDFLFTPVDLAGGSIEFQPNGTGGYLVTAEFLAARIETGLPGCTGPNLTFTPDGAGGYTVSSGGVFDYGFAMGSTDLGLGDDTTADVALAAPFTMPGGAVVNSVRVDSNGRISDPAAALAADFIPTVVDFLGDPSSQICPAWTDLDPSSGGTVVTHATASGLAITWRNVPQFGQTTPNTFQVQLRQDDSIVFAYATDLANDDLLVGLTAGAGAIDPGEVDLFSATGLAAGSTVYEFFDSLIPDLIDLNRVNQPSLVVQSLPVIGSGFTFGVNSTNAIAEFVLIGNSFLLPLGVIPGLGGTDLEGCALLTDSLFGTLVPPGIGATITLAVPNRPAFIGLGLTLQGAVLDPSAANPFALRLTDAVLATVGL